MASTGNTYRVEIGAWIESDQPKKNGSGMRKVWVAGDDGDRLSVIASRDGRADAHVVTLRIGTPEERSEALAVIGLAHTALSRMDAPTAAPAPKPAPTAPKAPKAPVAPTAASIAADLDKSAVKANRAIAEAIAPKPAPESRVMCDERSHTDNAQAGAKFCPLCGKDLTALARAQAVATARANKPAPAPKVASPAPKAPASPAYDPTDWAALIG